MTELEEQKVVITTSDLIYQQVKDIGKRLDRLENRMDRLEEELRDTRKELNQRMEKQDERIEKLADKIEALRNEQDERIEKLADKIEALRNDLRLSTNHGQISTITTIGIALAVIYSLFTR